MLSDFEAFLLSKMRATGLVSTTLAKECLSRDELILRADRASRRWGLARLGHEAKVYLEAIGRPIDEGTIPIAETGSAFAGSVRRLYYLQQWPRVLFRVNEHPTGYAWGQCFVQDPHDFAALDPTKAKAWDWTDEVIESKASQVEVLEHWNHEKDLRVSFIKGDIIYRYLCKFDFGLLQEWAVVGEKTETQRESDYAQEKGS